jgi:hypothetical protein
MATNPLPLLNCRNCQQLCKYLVTEHEVPAAMVKRLKSKLGKVMEEVADWAPFDELTVRWFDKQMGVVEELLGGQFEHWNPRTDPVLGKVVTNLERICTFGVATRGMVGMPPFVTRAARCLGPLSFGRSIWRIRQQIGLSDAMIWSPASKTTLEWKMILSM